MTDAIQEGVDISTPPEVYEEADGYCCDATRLVRQYIGRDVPASTNSNTRTGMRFFCKFVADFERRLYMLNKMDIIESWTCVFK